MLLRPSESQSEEIVKVANELVQQDRQIPPANKDDCISDVIYEAFTKYASFDSTRNLRAWLYGIKSNVSKNLKRKFAREKEKTTNFAKDMNMYDCFDDPDFDVVNDEYVAKAAEAILDNVTESQLVYLAAFANGTSTKELAAEICKSEVATRVAKHRAKGTLRSVFEVALMKAGLTFNDFDEAPDTWKRIAKCVLNSPRLR